MSPAGRKRGAPYWVWSRGSGARCWRSLGPWAPIRSGCWRPSCRHQERRCKLSLALGLARQVWCLVLDEPTNHLDLPSVERMEVALTGFPGAVVLVTHDDRLAAAVTNTEWHIDRGTVTVV